MTLLAFRQNAGASQVVPGVAFLTESTYPTDRDPPSISYPWTSLFTPPFPPPSVLAAPAETSRTVLNNLALNCLKNDTMCVNYDSTLPFNSHEFTGSSDPVYVCHMHLCSGLVKLSGNARFCFARTILFNFSFADASFLYQLCCVMSCSSPLFPVGFYWLAMNESDLPACILPCF